jgi:thiamine biosynthesis lipoprotein
MNNIAMNNIAMNNIAMNNIAMNYIAMNHIAMIHKLEFRAMGCQMLAALDHPSPRAADRLNSLPSWFEAWEQSLSRFRSDSELSQFNHLSGSPQRVSLTFWRVLQEARQAELLSDGLVTPLVLDAIESAGYVTSFENLVHADPGASQPVATQVLLQQVPRLAGLDFDDSTRMMCLPAGARLDFGGIAKGWAAHQAMKRLAVFGPVLVDAGGDISISGCQRDGSLWPVAVADPLNPETNLGILMMGKSGIATSGKDYRRWLQNGRWQHHIIDPRTGLPAETDILSATVVAPDVIQAETAAKTVMILGSREGLDWLDMQPAMEGILVLEDGRRLNSHQLDEYLWS